MRGASRTVTLNAPKGLGLQGATLFVADIDEVRLFTRATGAPLGARPVPGATFLNDLAVGPDGTVYVTDSGLKAGPQGFLPTGTDAVYRFDRAGRAVAVARDTALEHPNGVLAEQGKLTDALKTEIADAHTQQRLADRYLPSKPKRRTTA